MGKGIRIIQVRMLTSELAVRTARSDEFAIRSSGWLKRIWPLWWLWGLREVGRRRWAQGDPVGGPAVQLACPASLISASFHIELAVCWAWLLPLSPIGFFVSAQFYLYRTTDSCCLEWDRLVLDGSSSQVGTWWWSLCKLQVVSTSK